MTTEATAGSGLLGKVQDYWNRRPCNIRHSTKPVGTKEYFDEVERLAAVESGRYLLALADFRRAAGTPIATLSSTPGYDSTTR